MCANWIRAQVWFAFEFSSITQMAAKLGHESTSPDDVVKYI